jgi:23S rRNA (adenine2503-C2)-methyltransferase
MKIWDNIKRIDDEAERVAKFIFTRDNAVAEAVLYRYPTYLERTVICCSTQSGCPVGCRFCGAGDYFVRSLTTEEIVSQVEHLLEETNCNPASMKRLQIMFMSMGEPLLNLKNLVPALRILYNMYPNATLLISTSAPRINDENRKLLMDISVEIPTIGLQFSVHESTDEERNLLIPFKKKLTLDEIVDFGTEWFTTTSRKPFFNYCAHDNNSSEVNADEIYLKFNPFVFNATVSVVCERNDGMAASNQHQRDLAVDFAAKLVERGYDVRVFDPAGQDTIGGGCGQLHYVQQWFKDNPNNTRPSIGYGKDVVHAPREVELT